MGPERIVALAALLLATACAPSGPPTAARPANLLLITLDTTRADRLGCYGYDGGTTPHLDRLAARGARFEQAIVPVALTRPSHTTLFTGQLPHRHGVWSNGPYRLAPESPLLSEVFQQAGFRTAGVVASFVLARSFGFDRGFSLFDDSTQEVSGGDPEKDAAEVARVASSWLRQSIEPPFFLWLHFYDPHHPYAPPRRFAAGFQDPYDGEIAYVDETIGALLGELESTGWARDTLIVAVADHGEGLGERGETTHGYFLYDNTVRVPLILAGPGVPEGRVIGQQVTLADLAPTLREAFGLPPAGVPIDGRSFWQELRRGVVEERPALLENRAIRHQYGWAALAGVRASGWKWLSAPVPELYDLRDDPGEEQNLAQRERGQAAELERRRRELEPDATARSAERLTPEEEDRLAALGYVGAAGPGRESPPSEVDPKRVAPVIAQIEEVIAFRRSGRVRELDRPLERILATDPGNLFALRIRAQQLVEERRFGEALEVLQGVVEGHETHPEAMAFLAAAYEGSGDPTRAAYWLERATAPPWVYWPALESLSRLAARNPAVLPRDALLVKLGAFSPASGRERLSLARAFALASEHDRAEEWFRQSLAADPGLVEARVGLAQMLAALGRPADSLSVLAEIGSETVESAFVSGTVLAALDRRQEACDAFRRSIGLDPRNLNLLLGLARSLEACGEEELATDAYRRVLGRVPAHALALEALDRLEAARSAG